MPAIKNVGLAGATGNLGPAILKALTDADFNVTVYTRDASRTKDLPAGAKAVTVDYTSPASVKSAVAGQDAIISTLSGESGAAQNVLIDAAVASGVQRFLPSEFGCDYSVVGHLAVFKGKIQARKYIEEAAKTSDLSYTYVTTNAFLDWGLNADFLLTLNSATVDIYDGGDTPFSATTLASIGQAVVGVLRHPVETKNRQVLVSDAVVTQNQLLRLAEEVSGKTWKVQAVSSAQREQDANAELQKENPDKRFALTSLIHRAIFGGPEYHNLFSETELDNELLGLGRFDEAGIRALVKAAIK